MVIPATYSLSAAPNTHCGYKLTRCGTPEYVAPEMLRGDGVNFGCDWWAVSLPTSNPTSLPPSPTLILTLTLTLTITANPEPPIPTYLHFNFDQVGVSNPNP